MAREVRADRLRRRRVGVHDGTAPGVLRIKAILEGCGRCQPARHYRAAESSGRNAHGRRCGCAGRRSGGDYGRVRCGSAAAGSGNRHRDRVRARASVGVGAGDGEAAVAAADRARGRTAVAPVDRRRQVIRRVARVRVAYRRHGCAERRADRAGQRLATRGREGERDGARRRDIGEKGERRGPSSWQGLDVPVDTHAVVVAVRAITGAGIVDLIVGHSEVDVAVVALQVVAAGGEGDERRKRTRRRVVGVLRAGHRPTRRILEAEAVVIALQRAIRHVVERAREWSAGGVLDSQVRAVELITDDIRVALRSWMPMGFPLDVAATVVVIT